MLEIIKFPQPVLLNRSKEVTEFDDSLHQLLKDMVPTMYKAKGIGLAAPQVDVPLRVFVIDISQQDKDYPQVMEFVNPKIISQEGNVDYQEGCLSVPGFSEVVRRSAKVHLEFQDRFGEKKEVRAEGLLAIAIQHEHDHLEGKLFIDRLSALKRTLIKKKIRKNLREQTS